MIDHRNERHLYVVLATSGWRIERPSGNEVVRALPSYEAACALLEEAGYRHIPGPAGLSDRFDRGDIR